MMGEYTTGGRLHQCYSFDMLGLEFEPAHFRGLIEQFFREAPDGWPSWAFSNHDVVRHVTRWSKFGASQDALAKLAGALLLSLQGSICIYQGDELGQSQTELEYHELDDPQGKRFWPEDKGRDGCRTPMVWDGGNASSGFSTGTPWLPIKPPQAARHAAGQAGDAGSVLEFYRRMLAIRRGFEALRTGATEFFDTSAPVLAFARGGEVLCVFNLSPEPQTVRLAGAKEVLIVGDASRHGENLRLGPNGFALITISGPVSVADA
jgi:alpha-glucosidase